MTQIQSTILEPIARFLGVQMSEVKLIISDTAILNGTCKINDKMFFLPELDMSISNQAAKIEILAALTVWMKRVKNYDC